MNRKELNMDAKKDDLQGRLHDYSSKILQNPEKAAKWFQKALKNSEFWQEVQNFMLQNSDHFLSISIEKRIICFFITANLAHYFDQALRNIQEPIKKTDITQLYEKHFNQMHIHYEALIKEELKNSKKISLALLAGNICTAIHFFKFAEDYYKQALIFCSQQENSEKTSYCFLKLFCCHYEHALVAEKQPAPELAEQQYGQAIEAISEAINQPQPYKINKLWLFRAVAFFSRSLLLCNDFHKKYQNAAEGFSETMNACLEGLKTDMNIPKQKSLFLEYMKKCFQMFEKLNTSRVINIEKQGTQSLISSIKSALRVICQPHEPALLELDVAMNSLLASMEEKKLEQTFSPPPTPF